jgi:DNA-binding MarR family transcriptional regulator
MPVNHSPPLLDVAGSTSGGAGTRLYLREDELDRAIDLFGRAHRSLWQAAQDRLHAHALGPAHLRALAAVRRLSEAGTGPSVGALQANLGVRKQSLARVLTELETAGLVRRAAPAGGDRRQRLLALTPAGKEAEQAASAALRERLAAAFRRVGPEAVAGARGVLAALLEPDAPGPET